jgi:ribosome-associated translation inhibitor RaiA
MRLPLQVTFRNVQRSSEVEQWIEEEAAKLDQFYSRIMGCRVLVEMPSRHRRKGGLYHVRIDLTVPGGELVVKEQPSLPNAIRQTDQGRPAKRLEVKAPHKDMRQTINDAFNAMARRLQEHARRRRGDVKTHEGRPRARVASST